MFSQNFTQFSLGDKFYNYHNPSYVASEGITNVKALHRSQWTHYQHDEIINPRPLTQLVTFEHPISFFSKSVSSKKTEALGLSILNDNIGIVNQISLDLALAKKVMLSETKKVAFGLSFGILSQRIKNSSLTYVEENDPTIQSFINSGTIMEPTISAGVRYEGSKSNVGFAIKNLIANDNKGFLISQKTLLLDFKTRFSLSSMLDIIPLIHIASDFKTQSYLMGSNFRFSLFDMLLDFNVLSRHSFVNSESRSLLWTNNDMILQLGIPSIPRLALGFYYSLDVVTFGKAAKSALSHEFMMIYQFDKKKHYKEKQLFSPRYKYN